jgi:hypothetical protein
VHLEPQRAADDVRLRVDGRRATAGAADEAAALVRGVLARVVDDLVEELAGDLHRPPT